MKNKKSLLVSQFLFGYLLPSKILYSSAAHKTNDTVVLLIILLIELARQSAQCHYDVTSFCSQAYCTARL